MKNALPGFLWCLSALLAAWLWAPHPAAAVAGLLGCLSATALSLFPRSRGLWLGFSLSCLFGVGILFALATYPISSPSLQILIRSSVLCWLVPHALVFLLHQADRTSVIPLECALFATPWVLWLKAHRFGNLDRPVSLMEPFQSVGIDPTRVLAFLGILVGISILLLIGSRQSRQFGLAPILALLLFGLTVAVLVPTERVGRLATKNSQAFNAGEALEQKVSTPVAVVVFYTDYQPDLEVYHFRPYQDDRTDVVRPKSQKLHYRVAEIVAQDQILVQGWGAERTPIVVPDGKAFASVYEVRSQVPMESLIELMDSTPTHPPAPADRSRWQTILDDAVPLDDRSHPLRMALRVKIWMEQNRAQGPETVQGTVEDSLLRAKPVNQETFVRAAHQLLLDLGVANQVVSGYAIRTDQKGTGSYLLITEQDRRWWLELTAPGYVGMVVDLYPLDAPNQADTPQNFDLQRQMGELARAREPKYQPLPGLSSGSAGFLIFLFVGISLGYGIKLYRWLRGQSRNSQRTPVWAYRAVLDRLAEVKELRASGETRYEFSQRLKETVPSLEILTITFQRHTLGSPGTEAEGTASALARSCAHEIARSYPRRHRWLGYIHPFSWLRVH